MTDASPGPAAFIFPTMGWTTVEARTSWSYCLMAHSLEATLGSDSIERTVFFRSVISGNDSSFLEEGTGML